ncbi:MAG: 3-dehydroquinate synthase [Acidimicrobiales bacterium]|nr:MAG: 3-dehydroquinate synthase [Acidimicrobiales bacterium]
MTIRIPVTGSHPYDVLVGVNLIDELPRLIAGAEKVAILHQPTMLGAAESMSELLESVGFHADTVELPDAEQAKSYPVAQFCWDVLGQAGLTRSDVIVSLGGGAVTDLAGFVAATWLRGIRVVHVPTSLLAMVDAAVGGKTGINTDAGKNLVGAFHPPAGVLCDLVTLTTLPRDELVNGLAEVVKCGFIADSEILHILETTRLKDLVPTSPIFVELIERAIRVKANVVSADLTEQGPREILNYGHTFAHAVERAEQYRWRHGFAVSVGMLYAAELGRLAGKLNPTVVDRHRAILGDLGLPTSYHGADFETLLATMRKDKKARGATLRMIVLEDVERPVVLNNPNPQLLAAAYREVT